MELRWYHSLDSQLRRDERHNLEYEAALLNFSPITLAPERNELQNEVLEFYLGYWQRKRGVRPMPSRDDLKPHELKPYLGHLLLVDALAGFEDFRFRLVGTRVAEHFLSDATGHSMREECIKAGKTQQYIDMVVQIHRTVCEQGTTMLVKAPRGEWRGHAYPAFETLYLPLSQGGAHADMIMGAFSFNYRELESLRGAAVTSV